ncbi:MAG: hypothetical protein LAT64_14115 [Phycisphaerales bacterium]|nr:hypothetical protein [Planctomycetota bacterium]MCH8509886.1 hypothetical protein [Phycisphaerales bacterium]
MFNHHWTRIPEDRFPLAERAARRFLAAGVALYALAIIGAITTAPYALGLAIAAAAMSAGYALIFYEHRETLGCSPRTSPCLPHRMLTRYSLSLNAVWVNIGVLFFVAFNEPFAGDPVGYVIAVPPFVVLGFTLIHTGSRVRVPGPPCCPACDYPAEGLNFPTNCPECAHRLASPDDCEHTAAERRPQRLAAGAAILLSVVALLVTAVAAPSSIYQTLPINARLAMAPTTPAFNTINLASLTPDQTARLTDRILDARTTTSEFAIQDQLAWLGQRFVDGHLTPEQAERFATEGNRIEIHADPIRRVGATMAITLTGQPPAHHHMNPSFYYFTRGFSINNAPPTGADPHKAHFAMSLHHTLAKDSTSAPFTSLTPDTPSPLHIRIDLIAVTTPRGAIPTITRHDDGTYTITPEPLTTHERTIETTIHIAP